MGRRGATEETIVVSGATMGTAYRVTIPRLSVGVSTDMIGRELREVLDHVDATVSTYQMDSEVSHLNRAAPDEWVPVSADTCKVATAAMAMAGLPKARSIPR